MAKTFRTPQLKRSLFDTTIDNPTLRVQSYLDGYGNDQAYNGPDRLIFKHIKVVSAKRTQADKEGMMAHVVFEMKVFPEICNGMNNMHGGAVAMLVDNTTTAAACPIAEDGFWNFGGVSRTLQVTYLRPMPMGTTVVIENMVRSVGRSLAAIQCIIRDKESGKVAALGEHGKAALEPQVKRKRSGVL